MHACGHDGHTAMLLIAAKILAQHKDEIKGNVVFLFQPNEEGAGAEDMVKQGLWKSETGMLSLVCISGHLLR